MLLSLIQRTANSRISSLALAALHTPAVLPSKFLGAVVNRRRVHPISTASVVAGSFRSSNELCETPGTSTVVPSATSELEDDELFVSDPRLRIWRDEEELLRVSVERLEEERELASMRRKCEEELQSLREGLKVREGQVERIVRRVITKDPSGRWRAPVTQTAIPAGVASDVVGSGGGVDVVAASADEPLEVETSVEECGAGSSSAGAHHEPNDDRRCYVGLNKTFLRNTMGQTDQNVRWTLQPSSAPLVLLLHEMEEHATDDISAAPKNARWSENVSGREAKGIDAREHSLKVRGGISGADINVRGKKKRKSNNNTSSGTATTAAVASSSGNSNARSCSSNNGDGRSKAKVEQCGKRMIGAKKSEKQPTTANKKRPVIAAGSSSGAVGRVPKKEPISSENKSSAWMNTSQAWNNNKSRRRKPPMKEIKKTTSESGNHAHHSFTRRRQA